MTTWKYLLLHFELYTRQIKGTYSYLIFFFFYLEPLCKFPIKLAAKYKIFMYKNHHTQTHPCDRSSPSFSSSFFTPFCVTFTLLHVWLCCLHAIFLSAFIRAVRKNAKRRPNDEKYIWIYIVISHSSMRNYYLY